MNTTLATALPTIAPLLNSDTPLSITQLAESVGSTPGTMEKVLRKLIKCGYLIRTPHGRNAFHALYVLSSAIAQ